MDIQDQLKEEEIFDGYFVKQFTEKGIYLHLDSESYRLLQADNLTEDEFYMKSLGLDSTERLNNIVEYFKQGVLIKGFYTIVK